MTRVNRWGVHVERNYRANSQYLPSCVTRRNYAELINLAEHAGPNDVSLHLPDLRGPLARFTRESTVQGPHVFDMCKFRLRLSLFLWLSKMLGKGMTSCHHQDQTPCPPNENENPLKRITSTFETALSNQIFNIRHIYEYDECCCLQFGQRW